MAENDPGQYDLHFWLDYFQRTHSDAARLERRRMRGILPDENPAALSQPMDEGHTDLFGDLMAGCRKLNMVVLARTDPHACHQDVYDAHPDWIAVDESRARSGRITAMPGWWVTCALGPYNFEFMTEVTREIMTMYQPEGIFSNRWAGSGMCYCEQLPARILRPRPGSISSHPRPAKSIPPSLHGMEAAAVSSNSVPSGIRPSAR